MAVCAVGVCAAGVCGVRVCAVGVCAAGVCGVTVCAAVACDMGVYDVIVCALRVHQVDLAQVRFYTRLFEWSGKNWMFLYIMVVAPVLGTLLSGFYWIQPENNLVSAPQSDALPVCRGVLFCSVQCPL